MVWEKWQEEQQLKDSDNMCLYPKLILNRKYTSNKKNGGNVPVCRDERLRYVTAACGKCLECRKQKQRQWIIRMSEEIRNNPNAYFVTLTIDDESYKKLSKECKSKDDNDIATKAMRMFLERVRKVTKKSIKHWFITEKGHENTKRLHLHGILWGIGTDELCKEKWKYGFVFIGTHVSEQTVNYITKYMLKVDEDNKGFVGKILCSAGIGRSYMDRIDSERNKYEAGKTDETYRLRNGGRINLPIYYRNKIYSEEEREKLFIEKLDKGEVWIMGEKCRIDDEKSYTKLMEWHRKKAAKLFGDNEEEWEKEKYWNRLKKQRKAVHRSKDSVL